MGKNAFYVVLFCGRSDMCHLPSLSQVAKHKQHVSSVGDDHFYSGGGGRGWGLLTIMLVTEMKL